MRKFILITLIIGYNSLFGSIVYHKNFDLHKYDLYDNIYEIEIIDILSYDTSDIPLLTLSERISVNYKVKIISYFKGNTLINDSLFNKEDLWKMKIGETYIIYDSDSLQRDVQYKYEGYDIEIENLKKLNIRKGYVILNNGNQKIAEGNFKRGKRDGIWKIFYLVPEHFTSDNKSVIFIEIIYRKGKVIGMKNYINEEYFNYNDYFNKEMEWFYYCKFNNAFRRYYLRESPLLYHLAKSKEN